MTRVRGARAFPLDGARGRQASGLAVEPRAFIIFVVVCVALLFAIAANAHEIGKTQVQASLRNGAYQIDVVVDPDALLTKLQVFSGRMPASASLCSTPTCASC